RPASIGSPEDRIVADQGSIDSVRPWLTTTPYILAPLGLAAKAANRKGLHLELPVGGLLLTSVSVRMAPQFQQRSLVPQATEPVRAGRRYVYGDALLSASNACRQHRQKRRSQGGRPSHSERSLPREVSRRTECEEIRRLRGRHVRLDGCMKIDVV